MNSGRCWNKRVVRQVFRRFIELMAPLEDVPSRVVVRMFLSELKPTIKKELFMWAPSEMGRAMDLVLQIEDTLMLVRSNGVGASGI